MDEKDKIGNKKIENRKLLEAVGNISDKYIYIYGVYDLRNIQHMRHTTFSTPINVSSFIFS